MDMERLKKQMEFIVEVDKVKNIFRQTYLADGNRKENDAEHSWHLALMAVLLQEYSNEKVDLSKVIPMVKKIMGICSFHDCFIIGKETRCSTE